MNKSEIAEQIVEYVRRNHNSRSDKLMELIAAYDGERAIAESQAPQVCPKCGIAHCDECDWNTESEENN